MIKFLPTLISLVLVLTACSSTESDESPAESTADETTLAEEEEVDDDAEESDDATSGVNLDSPAGQQLAWFVESLNADEPPTVTDIEEHFSQVMLDAVPADVLISQTPQIFAAGEVPFEVLEMTNPSAGALTTTAVLEASNGVQFEADISVEPDSPHLINGLFVRPVLDIAADPDATFESLGDDMMAIGSISSLGAYDVTDGTCEVVGEVRPDEPVILGSTFKLWILAELANQIEAGDASWDETMAVTDNLRSGPDGAIYPLDTGTEVTLEELATEMISISDNTATDMLLNRLGRENVEATMAEIGIENPAANIPMMSTANLFQLKFVPEAPNAVDYRDLDEAAKRAMLEEMDAAVMPWVNDPLYAPPGNAEGVPVDQPRDLDIEWFATPRDLCLTHIYLAEQADRPGLEPVADIVDATGDFPFDAERWQTVRFKGGSEPGVLAGAFWLEDVDGNRYVIAGGIADPDVAINPDQAMAIILSAAGLIP